MLPLKIKPKSHASPFWNSSFQHTSEYFLFNIVYLFLLFPINYSQVKNNLRLKSHNNLFKERKYVSELSPNGCNTYSVSTSVLSLSLRRGAFKHSIILFYINSFAAYPKLLALTMKRFYLIGRFSLHLKVSYKVYFSSFDGTFYVISISL